MHRVNYLTKNNSGNVKLHPTSDAFTVSITLKRLVPVPFPNNAYQTPVQEKSTDHTEYRHTRAEATY